MVSKTFIPNWYLDKKSEIRNKKIEKYILLASVVNIFLLSFILNISNKIKNYEQGIGNENNSISIVETVKQDIINIETYKELSDFFQQNNLTYKNIVITKGNLEMDIEVKSYEEYIEVIRCIENHYSIKKLTPNIKDNEKFNFKVILEV